MQNFAVETSEDTSNWTTEKMMER